MSIFINTETGNFLTNFTLKELDIYIKAIEEYNSSELRIGPPAKGGKNIPNFLGLYRISGSGSLTKFWDIFHRIRRIEKIARHGTMHGMGIDKFKSSYVNPLKIKMPKMPMIDPFKLYDMPMPKIHDDFLDSMRCAMRPGLYSTKNINKEKKEMPTNKEIREMAQHGIDNRIKMLREGELLSELEDCRFCEAFSDCNDCPFPGNCRISSSIVGDNDNSYKRFISHYNSEHKPYAKSIMDLGPRILCSKCLDLVNNWEADLKEIISNHPDSKREKLYSIGDRFIDHGANDEKVILAAHYALNRVGLFNLVDNVFYPCATYNVKNLHRIKKSEVTKLLKDKTQISGKYFTPEERCPHGRRFGIDWSNDNNSVCYRKCDGILWDKCDDEFESKLKGSK